MKTAMLGACNMNSFIASYNRAPAQTVSDVYKNPSEEKKTIERMILRGMAERNGWGYKVINHSCQHFTAGYLYPEGYTGEIILRVHTPRYTTDMEWRRTDAKVV